MTCGIGRAQTTSFTYQGKLTDGGAPANGPYDLQFKLYDALTDGSLQGSPNTVTKTGVQVTNSIFTVQLDFGASAFPGAARFLEISVKRPADGSYTALGPRQPVSSTPYAVRSLNAASADRLPGLRTETTGDVPNVIGGSSSNTATGVEGATIGGGGASSAANRVTDDYGTVGGGRGNIAGNSSLPANDSSYATVGGGIGNTASGQWSTVGGGDNNTASGLSATVNGGQFNTASGGVSTVAGGSNNVAEGLLSFAAGSYAHAKHAGTFVWADSAQWNLHQLYPSTGPNQFLIKASGGVGINTNAPAASLHILGASSFPQIQPIAVIESSGDQMPLAFKIGVTEHARIRSDNAGNLVLATLNGGAKDIYFRAGDDSGTDMFIRSSDGTVGIGTTSPNDKLEVNGVIRVNALGSAGGTQLCRNLSNQISNCSSSLRYKTNVAPLSFGLSVIKQLRPITFDWKQGGIRDVGFGAEDVAKINPLFVTYNDKGEVEGVKYDRLSVVFVNAFNEQQSQIEKLQKLIESQQQQIDALKKLVCATNPDAAVCKN